MSSKHRKVSDFRNVMDKINTSLLSGTIYKLFEDNFFIFELIKLLYEDAIEVHVKVEILTIIEQYGSGALPLNSVDQVITALLDVFRDTDTSPTSISMGTQLLMTVTTIFIESQDLMESEIGTSFISLLKEQVNKVNNIPTRRVRACSCQCLAQMETWRPGLLWRYRDILMRLIKEEKTDVSQDYIHLLTTILNSQTQHAKQGSPKQQTSKSQLVLALEGKDLLPMVSQIMDSVFLLSPPVLTTVACSITALLKRYKDIPSTIFKPLLLQCLPSMDQNILFLMLHLQQEFPGEILSKKEEHMLLKKVADCACHPGFGTDSRLIIIQWLKSYFQENKDQFIALEFKGLMQPIVFDPLEVNTSKLSLLAHHVGSQQQDLSLDLHYLTQLSLTTGGLRVTKSLYHILYLHVLNNSSEEVQQNVLRITRKLFQQYPHLIPLIVDFLQAVRSCQPHAKLHSEILCLLHDTVLVLPLGSLLSNYHNYLQVWLLSAQDKSMYQQRPLRRLLELVKEAKKTAVDDFDMGCMVLNVCHTMLLHHHTDFLYSAMGDLLSYMMKWYGDCDVKDHARFYYALLALNSDAKVKETLGADLVEGVRLGENIADFFPGSVVQTAPAEIQNLEVPAITWSRDPLQISYEMINEKISYEFPLPIQDGLEEYWNQLLHLKTSITCSLKASLAVDSEFENIVAVSFLVSDNKQILFSDNVYLPFLSKSAISSVTYSMNPKTPDPATIIARAVFGHEKSTYECALPPINIDLNDFLLPFPWHLFDLGDKQEFFNKLWENYADKSEGKFQGVESVKILKCPRKAIVDKWDNALISTGNGNDSGSDDETEDDFLFFMPPRFHLLLHVQTRATDLVVQIASDYWPVLAHIDQCLDELVPA